MIKMRWDEILKMKWVLDYDFYQGFPNIFVYHKVIYGIEFREPWLVMTINIDVQKHCKLNSDVRDTSA